MSNLVEIVPDLWVSDNKSIIENINNYSNLNFTQLNCSKDLNFLYKSKKYTDKTTRLNLEKYELIKFYKYLHTSAKFIYDNIKQGNSVLVHCLEGTQYSPTIVAAYLIRYGKISLESSINILKSKSNIAFLNSIDFIYPLKKFEEDHNFNREIFDY